MTMTAGMTAPTRDQSGRRRNWTAGAAVVGLLLAGRAAWDIGTAVQYTILGVSTEARLVGITHVADGPGRMSHYARVRYVADGRPIIVVSANRIAPTDHEIGDMLPVVYLSRWPERVRLADGAGPIDSGTWFSLGLGIATGLWGLCRRIDLGRRLRTKRLPFRDQGSGIRDQEPETPQKRRVLIPVV